MNIYDELIAILRRKKEYLTTINKITEDQTDSINNKNDDELGRLIDEKQKNIDFIDNLDKIFLEKFNLVKTNLGITSLEQVDDSVPELKILKDEVYEIQSIINKIFLREKENSVKVQKEFDDIKDKLKEINGGKKAMNAYSGYNMPTSGGSFIDNKK